MKRILVMSLIVSSLVASLAYACPCDDKGDCPLPPATPKHDVSR